MQKVSYFCRVIAVGLSLASLAAEAGPMMAAFSEKSKGQLPFRILIAPINSQDATKLPKPRVVEIAEGSTASNIYLIKSFGIETSSCYVPDHSLVSVMASEKDKFTGYLNWPPNLYSAELRCKDRSLPEPASGKCKDGQAASLRPCANGDTISIFLSTIEEADVLRMVLKEILATAVTDKK